MRRSANATPGYLSSTGHLPPLGIAADSGNNKAMKTGICRTRACGVTLIELLVTLTALGILCAIAIPAYRDYNRRVNRTDAQRDLAGYALRLQRCFRRAGDYTATDCTLDLGVNAEATYTVTIEKGAGTYTLIATPINDQAIDSCGRFTLNQAGVRGVSGTVPPQVCWQRSGD